MPSTALFALGALLASPPALAVAQTSRWPVAAERLMAADAASFLPADLKRQLAKHRSRLMAGVTDAAAAESGARSSEEHRRAAARGARNVVKMIRDHQPFEAISYECGGVIHELAAGTVPSDGTAGAETGVLDLAKGSRFLGFPPDPFRDPETLVQAALPLATRRDAYDAAVTLGTRLLTWSWKSAGGNASIVREHPAEKGPFSIRE